MLEPCCRNDLRHLLFQINIICLLLGLIGTTAVIKHPTWFNGMNAAAHTPAGR